MSNTQILDTDREISNIADASKLTPSKVISRKGRKVTTKNETAGTSKKTMEPRKSWFG